MSHHIRSLQTDNIGKHFTVITDDAALNHSYYMQYLSNILPRWSIAQQKLDFTVKERRGKTKRITRRAVSNVCLRGRRDLTATASPCINLLKRPER